ncbi:MAG TPA: hypothetical protein VIF12_02285, partial [Micavibrio sp.]
MFPDNNHSTDYLKLDHGGIVLQGDWTIFTIPTIKPLLPKTSAKNASVDITKAERIDTAGARLIRETFGQPAETWNMTDRQRALFEFLPEKTDTPAKKKHRGALSGLLIDTGKGTENIAGFLYGIL